MLNQSDIEITARYAAYERLIEFLLTDRLLCSNPDRWDSIEGAIIGPNLIVTKGVIDLADLDAVEREVQERIHAIFARAADWAARALEQT